MNILSDSVLVESKSARDNQLTTISHDRATEVLNKTKALFFALWQGVGLATTEQVAEFYEVSTENARQLVRTHRDEFEADGLKTLKGKALNEVRDLLSLTSKSVNATIWTPRAALRLGMLLREPEIAKAVRTSLLDMFERVIPAPSPTPEPAALPSPDRLTMLKEAVAIGKQLGGFDDRQKMLLKGQLMNLLMHERLLPGDATSTLEAGQEPLKRVEVPISDRCLDLGYHPDTKQLLRIGQVAATFYRGQHGRPPQKREQFVGGTTRLVNVYTETDLSILDSAIHSVMGD